MTNLTLARRDLFNVPEDVAYFNSGFMGPAPRSSLDAARSAVDGRARPWDVTPADFFPDVERFRAEAARLIGADAEGIAITPSASYGIATAAQNVPLSAGEEILLLADQFPSNVYTWRAKAAASDAAIVTVQRRHAETWTEALLGAITPATRIIACPQTHWCDGGLVDLEAVGAAARAQGAALVLDLTQSLGVLPFDVSAVQPDFMATATYKWLLGPYSVGFIYVAPKHRDGVGLEEGWITREGSEDFCRLIDYRDAYQPGARRFDMGERSNFQLLPQAIASLRLLNDIGPANISAALGTFNADLARELETLGCQPEPEHVRSPHYLTARVPSDAPASLVDDLKHDNIFVSQRGAHLRITGHIHSTPRDAERLLAALKTRMM